MQISDPLNEQIVNAVYRGLLNRDPDVNGLRHHMELLRNGGIGMLEDLLRSSVQGPEFNYSRGESSIFGKGLQGDAGISHIISIGMFCYSSYLMKRAGLKSFSGPFDWIFSDLSVVADCLDDDFEVFLDRKYHRAVPVEEREIKDLNKGDHILFKERYGIKFMFNHHDIETDDGYNYFVRCVDRFRKAVKSPEGDRRALLLHTTHDNDENIGLFKRMSESLDRYSLGKTFAVGFLIGREQALPVPKLDFVWSGENGHELYRLTPTSRWTSLAFEDVIDDAAIVRALRISARSEAPSRT